MDHAIIGITDVYANLANLIIVNKHPKSHDLLEIIMTSQGFLQACS